VQRQHDLEARAAAVCVGGLGAPAVRSHDPGDDRQAEARAGASASGVRAPGAVEERAGSSRQALEAQGHRDVAHC
jgi:hypothetical protein